MSQIFASGGQSIGASAPASVLPMNIQGWFTLGLTDLISLLSKGLSRSSPAPQFKSINSLALTFLYGPTLTSIHDYWKNVSFDYMDTRRQSAKPFGHVQLFEIPCTVDCQTPLSMGFPSQEYWSGLPLTSPGYLPNSGIEPASPTLEGVFFTAEPPGKPITFY